MSMVFERLGLSPFSVSVSNMNGEGYSYGNRASGYIDELEVEVVEILEALFEGYGELEVWEGGGEKNIFRNWREGGEDVSWTWILMVLGGMLVGVYWVQKRGERRTRKLRKI